MAAPRKPFEPPTQEQADFLERTIEQYGKATYNFAFRLTQNEADARDLTQEAFIRVYRAWRSFKPGTSFLSWIYRIVTNLHRDELRRRKGRYQEEIPEDNAPQAFGGSRPLAVEPIDEYVESQSERTRLESARGAFAGSAPGRRPRGYRGVQLPGDRGDRRAARSEPSGRDCTGHAINFANLSRNIRQARHDQRRRLARAPRPRDARGLSAPRASAGKRRGAFGAPRIVPAVRRRPTKSRRASAKRCARKHARASAICHKAWSRAFGPPSSAKTLPKNRGGSV